MKKILLGLILLLLFSYKLSYAEEYFCCTWQYEFTPVTKSKKVPGLTIYAPKKFRCPVPGSKEILDRVPHHGEVFTCGGHQFKIDGIYIEVIK